MIAIVLSAVLMYGYFRFIAKSTGTMILQTAILVALWTPTAQAFVGGYGLGASVVAAAIAVVILSVWRTQ